MCPRCRETCVLHDAGHAAAAAGCRFRYFAAADLVETLYRGRADNSVGRLIDGQLRSDLIIVYEIGFAPLDAMGMQLLVCFIAAAYERRSLGVASHRTFDQWGASSSRRIPANGLILRRDFVDHVSNQLSLSNRALPRATQPKGRSAASFDDLPRDPFQLLLRSVIMRQGHQAIGQLGGPKSPEPSPDVDPRY